MEGFVLPRRSSVHTPHQKGKKGFSRSRREHMRNLEFLLRSAVLVVVVVEEGFSILQMLPSVLSIHNFFPVFFFFIKYMSSFRGFRTI